MKLACLLFLELLIPVFLTAGAPLFRLDRVAESHSLMICGRLMLVTARVDGRQGCFLLDTGVSQLLLNERLFGKNAMQRKGELLDANGLSHPLKEVFVRSFSWGALHREEFHAKVINLDSLEQLLDCRVLGLIGFEVLQDVEAHFDYGLQQLTLFRLDEQEGFPEAGPETGEPDHLLPFIMERHVPVIRAAITGCRSALRLGLDSGATLNIVDDRWENKLQPRVTRRHQISYNGAWSKRRSDFVTLDTLRIAEQLGLLYCKLALADLTHLYDNGIYVDGLLGIELFRLGRIALNYRRKTLSIWVSSGTVYAMRYRDLLNQTPPTRDSGRPYRK